MSMKTLEEQVLTWHTSVEKRKDKPQTKRKKRNELKHLFLKIQDKSLQQGVTRSITNLKDFKHITCQVESKLVQTADPRNTEEDEETTQEARASLAAAAAAAKDG